MMKIKKFFDDFNDVMGISTLLLLTICSFALGYCWGYYWNDDRDRTYRELKVLQEQIVELSQDNKRSIKKK